MLLYFEFGFEMCFQLEFVKKTADVIDNIVMMIINDDYISFKILLLQS